MKNLSDQEQPYYAVILAGGSGSRLWPLSRQQLPKQFLSLGGRENLLEATISRLEPLISPDQVVVVTSEKHATGEAFDVLDKFSRILEPVGRNTAAAIAVAAAWLLDIVGSDAVMVVLPADHLIKDAQSFRNCLEIAGEEARHGSLLTFGIQPTRPDTGFGYIQVDQRDQSVLDVIRFTEKPDLATAESFLVEGGYFWNSGMFVWKASAILDEISKHLPELYHVLESIRRQWAGGEDWQEVLRQRFAEMPSVSIDYGVMERSDNVRLVPVDIDWSDVGSWDAVYDVSDKDADGNVIDGQVLALGCRNSLLRGKRRLLAVSGLEDIIAVETEDAILLCRRGDSQSVRDIVDAVKVRGGREHIEHMTVKRPWGSYTVLEDRDSGYKLKRLEVNPGASLSLQSHQHRSEHWVVVSGTATVSDGDRTFSVEKNESTFIPVGQRHQLANKGTIPLKIVEVQVGDYLEEDDIERFEDRYGRMK